MPLVDSILQELEQEAARTKRLLERVPEGKLDWRPHAKSMSLGQLARHVANIPGSIAEITKLDEFEIPDFGNIPSAESAAELVPALEEGVKKAQEIISGFDDKKAMAPWKLMQKGKERMNSPRIGVLRMVLLNHLIHHRGQLSVYLRLLDVPLPVIYGASADENPYA